MPQSESTSKLASALAKAQAKFTIIKKDKTGQEGNLKFQYASLADGLTAVRPFLNAEGIYLSQPIVEGPDGIRLQTTKVQFEDEWISTDGLPLPKLPPGKELGKTVTYARRVDLFPFLGISGDDDDEDAPDLKPVANPVSVPSKPFVKPTTPATKPANSVKSVNTPSLPEPPVVPNKATSFEYGANVVSIPETGNKLEDGTFITNDDIPDFGPPVEPYIGPELSDDAAEVADHLIHFVPLTEERNNQIQSRLKELVASKTLDRRKLGLFLDAQHEGKKQYDVSASQWEQTIAKIEAAVEEGKEAIKELLKVKAE
jgi:hypothetical protein